MKRRYSEIKDFVDPGIFVDGQCVDLEIHSLTDLGYKAIVNDEYWGVLYKNEVFQDLKPGQQIEGFINRIRPDGKIDLRLYPVGNFGSTDLGDRILDVLSKNNGFLPITDKEDPEVIYKIFGVSKKKYKIALGGLYKNRMITVDDDGIRLAKKK